MENLIVLLYGSQTVVGVASTVISMGFNSLQKYYQALQYYTVPYYIVVEVPQLYYVLVVVWLMHLPIWIVTVVVSFIRHHKLQLISENWSNTVPLVSSIAIAVSLLHGSSYGS